MYGLCGFCATLRVQTGAELCGFCTRAADGDIHENGDKGMENRIEAAGGQNCGIERAGVSLTRPESDFLNLLADPFRDDEQLLRAAQSLCFSEDHLAYLEEWILCHGQHWAACENMGISYSAGMALARNPAFIRIIQAAAERGLCKGPVALKDEILFYLTQDLRDIATGIRDRREIAKEIAELQGYYPDRKGSGGTQVNIVIGDPYKTSPEVTVK